MSELFKLKGCFPTTALNKRINIKIEIEKLKKKNIVYFTVIQVWFFVRFIKIELVLTWKLLHFDELQIRHTNKGDKSYKIISKILST